MQVGTLKEQPIEEPYEEMLSYLDSEHFTNVVPKRVTEQTKVKFIECIENYYGLDWNTIVDTE